GLAKRNPTLHSPKIPRTPLTPQKIRVLSPPLFGPGPSLFFTEEYSQCPNQENNLTKHLSSTQAWKVFYKTFQVRQLQSPDQVTVQGFFFFDPVGLIY